MATAEQMEWIDCLRGSFDRTWDFEWGAVGYIERDAVLWVMWAGIEGAYRDGVWSGPRLQVIDVSMHPEEDIALLDAGEDPTCGWEDGQGNKVDEYNAIPVDADGEPLRWIVMDENKETHDEWVTYHGTQGEANGDAMSQWLHLTPRERKRRHVHVGYNEDLCFHLDGSYYVPDGCWDSDELPEEDTVDEVTTIAKISSGGSSLQLNLTRELKALGLDRGDRVEVTLRRI